MSIIKTQRDPRWNSLGLPWNAHLSHLSQQNSLHSGILYVSRVPSPPFHSLPFSPFHRYYEWRSPYVKVGKRGFCWYATSNVLTPKCSARRVYPSSNVIEIEIYLCQSHLQLDCLPCSGQLTNWARPRRGFSMLILRGFAWHLRRPIYCLDCHGSLGSSLMGEGRNWCCSVPMSNISN